MSVPIVNTDEYLSCAQAGEKLGLSPESIRRYCNNFLTGGTPVIQGFQPIPGGDWLIHKSEVARYKKERQGRGRPKLAG